MLNRKLYVDVLPCSHTSPTPSFAVLSDSSAENVTSDDHSNTMLSVVSCHSDRNAKQSSDSTEDEQSGRQASATQENCNRLQSDGEKNCNQTLDMPQQPKTEKGVLKATEDIAVSEETVAESYSNKPYHCVECGMRFAIFRVLEVHRMLEHRIPAQWRCEKCGMQFLYGADYGIHMSESHSPKPPHSMKPDNQKARRLRKQIRSSEEKRSVHSYKCQYCTAEFSHRSRLIYHTRRHTGEKPYSCEFCSKCFFTSSSRLKHVRQNHLRLRKFLCTWCGKKFFSASQLQHHTRNHTGEKPYSCPVCFRAFSRKGSMQVHIRQHTGVKPFVCDQCGQSFTVSVSLRTHLKSKHNIVVDTRKYRRPQESGQDIPVIGRPKRKDPSKLS